MNGGVIVRPATREDIAAFSDMADKPTVKAWVGEIDGKIVGMGGLALIGGRWFAFLDLTDEARSSKITLMRTAKRVMAEARRMGLRYVYAQVSTHEANAAAWLRSLGFELDPRSEVLYRWQD